MQTKKRAKPVKFGKTASDANAAKTKLEEKITKTDVEADINSDEVKELKHIIEEKTHPKEDELPEQEEATEDEPKEVNLSEEPPQKKEEEMPLENTEPITEVEPEELQEKEETSPFGRLPEDAVKKESKKSPFGFFLLVAFITFLVGLTVIGGFSYFSSSMSNTTTSSTTQNPTPATEVVASPTPEKPDLSAYSIRILNGSGTTGEAAKVKDLLEGKGFSVAGVGNAATSDYTKTVISAKKAVSESYINELVKALQEQYSVNSVVESITSSQTSDVVVTVGSDASK